MARTSRKQTKINTTLDLDRVVFDGDARLRSVLTKLQRMAEEPHPDGAELDPSFLPAPPDQRGQLLKNAIRLTPGLAPVVWSAIEHCKKFLGIDAPIEAYVEPNPLPNAFVLAPDRGRIVLGFGSGAVELLDEGELISVIGHELGHVIFEHHSLMPLGNMTHDERLSPADAMRFYAWMRYAELTADRVGLLCCDDFDTWVRAEFKLSSGLSDRHLGDVIDTAAQYTAIAKEKLEESELDWFSTHPYSPLRVRALDLFRKSTTFERLRGRRGGTITEADLEQEIKTIMDLMNPSCLDERAPNKEVVREFMALAGLTVAMADRRLDDLEMKALARFVGQDRLTPMLDDELKKSGKSRKRRMRELAETIRTHLSHLRRRKIVEDLCAIALADNQIAEREVGVLYQMAELIDVDPMEVENALGRAEEPLD